MTVSSISNETHQVVGRTEHVRVSRNAPTTLARPARTLIVTSEIEDKRVVTTTTRYIQPGQTIDITV
jgi:hypothetical protein